jgi:hypothetical protein
VTPYFAGAIGIEFDPVRSIVSSTFNTFQRGFMDARDAMYMEFRRGRLAPQVPGLIRTDRALLYLRKQTQEHIDFIAAKSTKTLGEYSYRLNRFAREMISLLAMGGDTMLAENAYSFISKLGSRTTCDEAVQRLRELLSLFDSYKPVESVEDIDVLKHRVEELEARLVEDNEPEANPIDIGDQRAVFVVMPFSADFTDVWKGGIQRAATEQGLHPIRVDMINRSSNITDDIVESIDRCHVAIVDVTANNPNVMFELGYTLAKGKPNIIISQSANFLPFDIRNIRTIVYSNSWSGIEELRSKLKEFLKEVAPGKPGPPHSKGVGGSSSKIARKK